MNLNPQFLKPQDILFLLKLAALEGPGTIFPAVPEALGLSKAEVHNSAKRVRNARLLPHDSWNPLRRNLLEFLVHGVKYVFPARHGSESIGMPTAWAASPLAAHIAAGGSTPPVWPDEEGTLRGQALYPLYPSAPLAARRDPRLYELLVLVDAIRMGNMREQQLAEDLLKERLL
jgi:hypothetical protein